MKDIKDKDSILNINSETVCFIISKSREFHAKEAASFPEKFPEVEYESDWTQILAENQDDLTFQEVKRVIEDLEPDQQTELLALMYVGREDFNVNEWSLAYKEAKTNLKPRLAEYLFSKPQLADFLENALSLLGYSCDE